MSAIIRTKIFGLVFGFFLFFVFFVIKLSCNCVNANGEGFGWQEIGESVDGGGGRYRYLPSWYRVNGEFSQECFESLVVKFR